ncbi:metallophosphoesterase family protein [Desulfosediminicola ganghwensis]|uniref:metallophosphoesterase family protein n=1 Tax=Desulfosediminicola ganghwensis TaxID=2569540 RepID=UPI0010AD307F|nr:metallophosphoesterase [Desulfosediminicola ganghwensis]
MKIAFLSDIHANMEALQAVLADLKERCAITVLDRVVCLGDLVGYGPEPQEVVDLVRKQGFEVLAGNHEAALANKKERRWMNFQARENNISTEALLSRDSLEYCCVLPRTLSFGTALCVHGCPPDSVNGYLYSMSSEDVIKLFKESDFTRFFVGHTHELQLVFEAREAVERVVPEPGEHRLEADKKYIINCGSVGQPRNGDNRAKYVIWDSESDILEICAVEYDIDSTVVKIINRGFPTAYAQRLK